MITIRDVARVAGVAVSTVSRVINQSGYVAKDTEARVKVAMQQLNFQPSGIARGLISRKTGSIGLLVPDVANPFFSDITRGAEDAAIAEGFSLFLCNSDWQLDRERMYLDILRRRWVDGVIVAGTRSSESDLLECIGSLPFVVVDRKATQMGSSVWSNNEVGALLATEHLIATGCQKIVHIAGPEQSPSATARKTGFLRAMSQRLSQSTLQSLLFPGDFRYEGGYHTALSLLNCSAPPDGIFAANDLMAIGVIQAAESLGLHIPQDLAVVGYDNIAMSSYVSPRLTTIDQPGYKMGQAGFEILLQIMQSKTQNLTDQEFEPTLIVRESTRSILLP